MVRHLQAPLADEAIRSVRAGDTVYLSGPILTARDAAHKRLMELLDRGAELPYELKGTIVYYAGPCPAPEGLPIGSCGPTTSSRMDRYAPRLVELGQRIMIGKGPRAQAVKDAIVRHGGLYLSATGGAGALIARCVKEVRLMAFEDLGTEAVRQLIVENMPLVAAIDSRGGDLFETGPVPWRKAGV